MTQDLRVWDDGQVRSSGRPYEAGTTRQRLEVETMLEWQGLPPDYLDASPYTQSDKRKLIGNAVPLAMGRAVASVVASAA